MKKTHVEKKKKEQREGGKGEEGERERKGRGEIKHSEVKLRDRSQTFKS